MFDEIKELYAYKELFRNLVKRELRTRYKGSALGFFWTFLNPLFLLAVYSVVFSFIMRVQVENYTGFLFVGLLPWLYFATSTSTANGLILAQANLVKKIYFPRLILPISTAAVGLINLILSFAVAIPVLCLFGQNISDSIIFLPLVLILQGLLVLGFVAFLSAMNVYFRDIEHVWGILLQMWMYATPILYPMTLIEEKYRWLFYLNPMTCMTLLYQEILYKGETPSLYLLVQAFFWATFFFFMGLFVYRKLQRRFAEVI